MTPLAINPIEKLVLHGHPHGVDRHTATVLNRSFRVATLSTRPYETKNVYSFRSGISGQKKRRIRNLNPQCLYCGVNKGTIVEHIIPVASGGTNSFYNLGNACSDCDTVKRSFSPKEIGWVLKPSSRLLANMGRLEGLSSQNTEKHDRIYRDRHPHSLYLPIKETFSPLKVVNNHRMRVKVTEIESERREVEFCYNGDILTEIVKSPQTTFGFIKASIDIKNLETR